MRSSAFPYFLSTLILACLSQAEPSSKRGLIYVYPSHHDEDYALFTSSNTSLSWYYNYSSNRSLPNDSRLSFVPMIYGPDHVDSDISAIKRLSGISHLLTFNEPDNPAQGTISPEFAARLYLNSILPLRSPPYNLQISLPATTGSSRGLQWLADFYKYCYQFEPHQGCPADFLATHWYGNFTDMLFWLDILHKDFPSLPIWLTEFAIPQEDVHATVHFVNQSLPYLDQLDYVHRYSWYGAFRQWAGNNFTGPSVAILDNTGGLTKLGVEYLGGKAKGFYVGEKIAKAESGGTTIKKSNVRMHVPVVCACIMIALQ